VWVVLDDVQFARRDYQHRFRVAPLKAPEQEEWLSLRVARPDGLNTAINDVRLLEPAKCQRRLTQQIKSHYSNSEYWRSFDAQLAGVTSLFDSTDSVAEIAEYSTVALLRRLGWEGRVVHSSDFAVSHYRSERLRDLTQAVEASQYICGTGGASYLDEALFESVGISVRYFAPPDTAHWRYARRLSGVWEWMAYGPDYLENELKRVR